MGPRLYLQATGEPWDRESAFLRWVQVCNCPRAVTVGTPCQFQSYKMWTQRRSPGWRGGCGRGLGARSRVALVPSTSQTRSPGMSCSHSPPSHPVLRSGYNSLDPERPPFSHLLMPDGEAAGVEGLAQVRSGQVRWQ